MRVHVCANSYVCVSFHMRLCALIEEQQNCSRAIGAWGCIVVVHFGGAFGAAVAADVGSAGNGCFAC